MGLIWICNIGIVVATLLATIIMKCVFMMDIEWNRYLDKLQLFKYRHIFTNQMMHEITKDKDDMAFWAFTFMVFDVVILGLLWLLSVAFPVIAAIIFILILIRIIVIKVKKC
ncbi:hypothetical protein [Vibrio phage XZ1]|nr:hypothetical protein [Vibrio phage XZ1]